MDESGCFFVHCQQMSFGKREALQGRQTLKSLYMTVAFIVSATGGKVTEPVVIWKSKIPRCFRYLEDKSRPANLHYFSNEKSWMNTDIMVKILSMLDAKMKSQNRNVILFIDNAPCHPPDLKGKFSNINVCFLPKNTTSRLQPLDAGIIQNFKVKYRKLLLKFVNQE